MATQPRQLSVPTSTAMQAAAARRIRERAGLLRRAVRIALLVGASVLFVAPFVWLVSASLKTRSAVFDTSLLPDPLTFDSYLRVWQVSAMPTWLWNSVVVALLAAATVTISSALVAFGFAYFRFRGRNALFGVVLATMMLPFAVTMIPQFLIWDWLGWTNTLVPLWAGNLFGSAFYIFLLRQFFLTIPRELFEAGRVDGANPLRLFWNLALPLVRPALVVVLVFELKASWTDLMKPLIFLRDISQYTLPIGLKSILDQFGNGGEMRWDIVLAASVIATIPMIVIFFLAQRSFVEGIATTGSKG
jgi:multiple sugar transport system permease protein